MIGVSLRPLWEMVGWVVCYIHPWNPSTKLVISFVCLVSYMIIKGMSNNAYIWPLPYTGSEWPSNDKGWDHWWYLEVGGGCLSSRLSSSSLSAFSVASKHKVYERGNVILMGDLPIVKSFHISTILLGPVWYSFFDAKNVSPSVSYLKAHQGQVILQ